MKFIATKNSLINVERVSKVIYILANNTVVFYSHHMTLHVINCKTYSGTLLLDKIKEFINSDERILDISEWL